MRWKVLTVASGFRRHYGSFIQFSGLRALNIKYRRFETLPAVPQQTQYCHFGSPPGVATSRLSRGVPAETMPAKIACPPIVADRKRGAIFWVLAKVKSLEYRPQHGCPLRTAQQ